MGRKIATATTTARQMGDVRDPYSEFSLFAGLVSYTVTTNTALVTIEPLLLGEIQG